jgi:hypothetical protein
MLIPQHVLLLAALLFSVTASLAAPGDTLYVKGNNVRVRTAPSVKAQVLRQVHYGHVVIEIERQGEWVKVSLGQGQVKIGWIHGSLVEKVSQSGGTGSGVILSPTEFHNLTPLDSGFPDRMLLQRQTSPCDAMPSLLLHRFSGADDAPVVWDSRNVLRV